MRLAVDTNIVFSILIGGRRLRRLFLEMRDRVVLVVPERMVDEIMELTPKAAEYIGVEAELVKQIYDNLVKPHIKTVKIEELPDGIIGEAVDLASRIDPDDWPFIALAMYLGIPLWTGDKGVLKLAVGTGFRYFRAVDARGVEMLLDGIGWDKVKNYLVDRYGVGL